MITVDDLAGLQDKYLVNTNMDVDELKLEFKGRGILTIPRDACVFEPHRRLKDEEDKEAKARKCKAKPKAVVYCFNTGKEL